MLNHTLSNLHSLYTTLSTGRAIYRRWMNELSDKRSQHVELLIQIYVIKVKDNDSCTIVGLPLPDDIELLDSSYDNASVNAALGYIVFVLYTLSCYLFIRLPYAMVFQTNCSYIIFNEQDGKT